VARADGASTSTSQEEQLGRIEATLKTYGRAMQSLTQTVQELQDHLMGPLDVWDYGIYSSHFSHGRGALVLEGSLVLKGVLVLDGALEGERVQAREGRWDEDLMSRLWGGDLFPRYFYYHVVLGVDICFSFLVSVKSTVTVAILGCISLQRKSNIFRVTILSCTYL
jgi:hypothetical protein